MITYISTRGGDAGRTFTDILLAGTASDGGLYVPRSYPRLSSDMLSAMTGMSYATIAKSVLYPFVGSAIDETKFDAILQDTYANSFDHEAVAPLVQLGPNAWIMELFHGPTLSFKDYALQLLGRLFDAVLEERNERVTIVGATSGDTGSAAIEACRGCKNIDIFILHPHERTSLVQRKQMTTVSERNVHNIALEGTFDDCQAIVKDLFADEELNAHTRLAAVNSINWARIMAQTVYYVAAAVSLGAPHRPVSFTIPTGNFGNIFAGWIARQMGVPISKLVVASNQNDILTRFFETGTMAVDTVRPSLSPSMDIQVSSNFERFLASVTGHDHDQVKAYMGTFKENGRFSVDDKFMTKLAGKIEAYRCDDDMTLAYMREGYAATGMFIDPHTAVGLHGATQAMAADPFTPMVILSTAHPAKFPEASERALGKTPPVPERLQAVLDKKEDFTVLPHDLDKVREFVISRT